MSVQLPVILCTQATHSPDLRTQIPVSSGCTTTSYAHKLCWQLLYPLPIMFNNAVVMLLNLQILVMHL